MTQLSCSVKNCYYNDDACCCKENIVIKGKSADAPNETCCGSFKERGSNTASNRVGEPEKATEVSCEAKKCVFNDECRCSAESIGVAGRSACCCGETECGSFRCDCA